MNTGTCKATWDPTEGHLTIVVGHVTMVGGKQREIDGMGQYATPEDLCVICHAKMSLHRIVFRRQFHNQQIYRSKSGAY